MNTITAPQADYIKRLQSERVLTDDDTLAVEGARWLWSQGELTSTRASALIDLLKVLPYREDKAPAIKEVPEGMHRRNGVIYKVQRAVHGSGHLYAKRLVVSDNGCGICGGDHDCSHTASADRYSVAFEYEAGALHLLSEATKMSLEEAQEFGALYGTCCVCGRTLTDEGSIAAGIGPVCAGKF